MIKMKLVEGAADFSTWNCNTVKQLQKEINKALVSKMHGVQAEILEGKELYIYLPLEDDSDHRPGISFSVSLRSIFREALKEGFCTQQEIAKELFGCLTDKELEKSFEKYIQFQTSVKEELTKK